MSGGPAGGECVAQAWLPPRIRSTPASLRPMAPKSVPYGTRFCAASRPDDPTTRRVEVVECANPSYSLCKNLRCAPQAGRASGSAHPQWPWSEFRFTAVSEASGSGVRGEFVPSSAQNSFAGLWERSCCAAGCHQAEIQRGSMGKGKPRAVASGVVRRGSPRFCDFTHYR